MDNKQDKKESIIQLLSTVLIAFQNINAPLTIQNSKYSNIVIQNLQGVIGMLNKKEEDEKPKVK